MLVMNIDELMGQFTKKHPEIEISFDRDNLVFHVHHLEIDVYEKFTLGEIIEITRPRSEDIIINVKEAE